ncbi:hypothetical protein DID80_03310 [Candidatus Marinamargulisbacteria bacterium SCGC AAA071-K20]|nr:hypothetical protein DID80_03310 [Candidatus Marinamargulisbacteria bacterium SCGC AAA071-K20]
MDNSISISLQLRHSYSSDSNKFRIHSNVERQFKACGGSTPKYVLWAKEYLSQLKVKREPRLQKELINFILDSFKASKPVLPAECGQSKVTVGGKSITIFGVQHTKSIGKSRSNDEATLLTCIQLVIREQKPNTVFLEMGMGNPRLTPQQKVIDPLLFQTTLQNFRLSPTNTDSEMNFAARRALAQNADCDVYNMEPHSITEEIIDCTDEWLSDEMDFSPKEFCTANRSAAMLHFFLGEGKYDGNNVDEFKEYVISKDGNSKEKWDTSFEIMKKYIPDFESILSDRSRHSESKRFSAPSAYVESPTILNRISDASCLIREQKWKDTIVSNAKASSVVLCGASHRENLARLFR